MIKAERASALHDITINQYSKFENDIETLDVILSKIKTDTKFTPIQLSALFHIIQTFDKKLIDDITTYCDKWAGQVSDPFHLKLWEQHINDKDYKVEIIRKRQDYFEQCIDELKEFSETDFMTSVKVIGPRKVTSKIKKQVWETWRTNENMAHCWTCSKMLKKSNWECGHIQAHAEGGSDDLDNLIIQCKKCKNNFRFS